MISATLHYLLACVAFIGMLATYRICRSQKNDQNQSVRNFFFFFGSFLAYHVFLSFPFFLSGANLLVMAWWYNFGVLFVFVAVFFCWRTLAYWTAAPKSRQIRIETIIIALGVVTFIGQSFFFSYPKITSAGLILWNTHLVSGIMVAGCGFIGALSFALFGLKRLSSFGQKTVRKRALFLVSGTFFLSLSTIYFLPLGVSFIYVAYFLHLIGLSTFAAAFTFRR